jgi:hypothetical protein
VLYEGGYKLMKRRLHFAGTLWLFFVLLIKSKGHGRLMGFISVVFLLAMAVDLAYYMLFLKKLKAPKFEQGAAVM